MVGNVLKQVPSAKYLGVYIDQHLTWQSHIDCVLRRVRGKVYSINHLNPPPTVRKLLYQGYILPIFDYCDVVWVPTTAKQTRRLERFHSKYTTFCTDLSISKYSLTEQRQYHTILQLYKILHKVAPVYLHDMFSYTTSITGREGRNAHCLFVPQICTNFGRRSLFYRGATLWNTLPSALYDAASYSQFKNNYLRIV